MKSTNERPFDKSVSEIIPVLRSYKFHNIASNPTVWLPKHDEFEGHLIAGRLPNYIVFDAVGETWPMLMYYDMTMQIYIPVDKMLQNARVLVLTKPRDLFKEI